MTLNLDNIVKNNLDISQLRVFNKIYYGREEHLELELKDSTRLICEKEGYQIAGYKFPAAKEETREPRIVKLGLIQHSIVLPTDAPVKKQRQAIFEKVGKIIEIAASEGVQIVCLQETWSMPFFLCTREKERWAEFAEPIKTGPSILFLSDLAKEYKIVIVSPILEDESGVWWNSAVVIDEDGDVLGAHRKNHLPSAGSFCETSFYAPGNVGHPVFQTKYAKIAVNICYGRHHALNWLMFALNGAEVVFNPAATIAEFGESFWGIEARNAAIANSYFTCSINRVGCETFTTSAGMEVSRSYYGSSYVSGPDGTRTPALSRTKGGLLIAEVDLNGCRQVKDRWGFNITSRLNMYAKELSEYINVKT